MSQWKPGGNLHPVQTIGLFESSQLPLCREPCSNVRKPEPQAGKLMEFLHLFLLSFHSTDSYWAPAVSKVLCQAVEQLGQYQHSHCFQLETFKDFGGKFHGGACKHKGNEYCNTHPGLSSKWILTDLHLPAKIACESCCWIAKYLFFFFCFA